MSTIKAEMRGTDIVLFLLGPKWARSLLTFTFEEAAEVKRQLDEALKGKGLKK